jgi:uncharacterized glyoxalase superfamily protein PhnB
MTVTPGAGYDDPTAGVAWLVDVLGFTEGRVFRDGSGTVIFAELHWRSSGAVFVSGHPPADNPWSAVRVVAITLGVDDAAEVDTIYARVVAAGGDVVRAPFLSKSPLFPDGSHQFDVRDPGGHLWTVGTYRPR